MRIKSLILLAVILVTVSLSGCSKSDISSTTNNPKVTVIEKTDTKFAHYEWKPVDEKTAINNADFIVKGKVLSTNEIRIDFTEDATEFSEYKTLVEFNVSEVFYSAEGTEASDEKISVILPVSSYNWEQMSFDMNEGKEYIIFASKLKSSPDDPMKLSEVASYAVKDPRNFIIAITDSGYEFGNIFENLKVNAETKDAVLGVTELNWNDFVDKHGFYESKKTSDNTNEIKSDSIEKDADKSRIKGQKFEDVQSYLQKLQNTFIRNDNEFESDLSELIKKNNK